VYGGKTTPMAISTQKFSASGWPQPTHAPATPREARIGGSTQVGYVTTGKAGPEAEVVVTDRSSSTDEPGLRGTKMADIKVAERVHVLQKRHSDPHDRMALVSFADDASIDCEWTGLEDPSALLAAIGLLSPGGLTCFRSGLEKAEELFARLPAVPGVSVLHKVILFTDGKNNEGEPFAVAERLKGKGVIIEAIGFGASEDDVDVDKLRRVVSIIDGKEQYWFCRTAQQLTQRFRTLSGKTRIFPV
jgi:hypothetical protein